MVEIKQTMLTSMCKMLGLQQDIILSEAKGWVWTIRYKQDPNFPDVGNNLLKLEKLLQQSCRGPVDLRIAKAPDKNKREQRNVLNGPKQPIG